LLRDQSSDERQGRAVPSVADAAQAVPNPTKTLLEDLLRHAMCSVDNDPDAARVSIARASTLLNLGELYELLPIPGGLSAWQEGLAKELLEASITERCSVENVAAKCGLPAPLFAKAFQRSTGLSPHRWLRKLRVERAKELLYNSSLTLAQITYDCGYADQAHFTRAFSAATGVCPGAWRRARRTA
jgi:AraC-like DNA-binding protein